eukprot:4540821-Pyramimonas_sp.AAC.1
MWSIAEPGRGNVEQCALLRSQGRRAVEKSPCLRSPPLAKMTLGIQEARRNRAQLLSILRKIGSKLCMHSSLAPGHHGEVSGGVAAVFPA